MGQILAKGILKFAEGGIKRVRRNYKKISDGVLVQNIVNFQEVSL